MTPRGTTYITVGRNGFYYRETLSSRRPQTDQTQLPPLPAVSAPSDEIPTADVSELVDSSSEQLVKTLNMRAQMFNPAWLVYIGAALMFVFGIASGPESNGSSTVGMPPLAGVDYSTLVARFGYPNSVLVSNSLCPVTVRTAFYSAANTGVVFVQEPCVTAYESVTEALSDQKKYPSLAKSKIRGLHPCLAPADAGWSIRRFIAAEDKADISVDQARERFAGLTRKETTPPVVEIEKRSGVTGKPGGATTKTAPGRELWTATDEVVRSIRENDSKAAAAVARQAYASYGLIAGSLGFVALGFVVHKRNADKRMSRLFYELSEAEGQKYSIVQQATASLAKAHQLWRVEANSPTWDWKRNAGASSLVRRVSSTVGTSAPPRVQTNIQTPSMNVGRMRLYFMPDLILIWDHGTFGAVPYDDFSVEQGSTRFIEDGYVPSDATVVGQTWRYVRRDGGPDRRFNNNRQLPIAQYGTLALRSSKGLNIHLQVSSLDASVAFGNCFRERNHRMRNVQRPEPSGRTGHEIPTGPQAQARRVLAVGDSASLDEISAAYRRLAQMYHPDKVAGLAPEFQIIAETRMKELNAAYEVLKQRQNAQSV